MSDKSEAAQKWAEAKERLEAAAAALDAATVANNEAAKAEMEAWSALQALAGRKITIPEAPDVIAYVTGPSEPTRGVGQMLNQRHSLPQKPIG